MTKINGIGVNPKDPLWKSAPERVEHLTKAFAAEANGFSVEDVINASAGMFITALRQAYATKGEAEFRYGEIFGRMKTKLLEHYDGARVRKVGVFPYDQDIRPELLVAKAKIRPDA